MADSKSDSIISEHFATKALDNPLWQYACEVYSKAGVETALLHLQDKHRADVNLILQALWLASKSIEWTQGCIPKGYRKWVEEQVLPLRKMRRSMKTDWPQHENFRQQVKKLELKAEQYALAMLFVHCENKHSESKQSGGVITAKENLSRLGQEIRLSPEHFELLITAL